MCGINGILRGDAAAVEAMNKATQHRGPDQTGVALERGLAIGNNRLAIIDISEAGRQPIESADGRIIVVFNGEIYNHRELREELKAAGIRFKGGSDTEVLANAIALWGPSCTKRLRGMWAFAAYDRDASALLLSRDPFGIKPLYLYDDGSTIAFSSELRGILALPGVDRSLDREAAREIISLGYAIAPRTIMAKTRSLLPGESLSIHVPTGTRSGEIERLQAPLREAPSERELEDVLADSLRHHLIADVTVGLAFSGGIDSSVLAALLKREGVPLAAFHISVPGRKDTGYARAIAKTFDVELVEEELSGAAIISLCEELFDRMDQPLADSSLLPSMAVAKLARSRATVLLSGEGGDELFGGYPRMRRLGGLSLDASARRKGPVLSIIASGASRLSPRLIPYGRALARRGSPLYQDPIGSWISETAILSGAVDDRDLRIALLPRIPEEVPDGTLALDRLVYLPDDLLLKGDTATMAYSLEGRVPFLDRRVFETVGGAPLSWKRAGGLGKAPLVRILERYLPRDLVHRPKSGFGAPIIDALLTRTPRRIEAALEWHLRDLAGLIPAFDAAVRKSMRRRSLAEDVRHIGHAVYAVAAIHAFADRHRLSA